MSTLQPSRGLFFPGAVPPCSRCRSFAAAFSSAARTGIDLTFDRPYSVLIRTAQKRTATALLVSAILVCFARYGPLLPAHCGLCWCSVCPAWVKLAGACGVPVRAFGKGRRCSKRQTQREAYSAEHRVVAMIVLLIALATKFRRNPSRVELLRGHLQRDPHDDPAPAHTGSYPSDRAARSRPKID
jgi:hypothetical protein